MEIMKVKVWKANKPQFEVVDRMDGLIYSVNRLADKQRFHAYLAVHLKGARITANTMNIISSFSEDLKTVQVYTYVNHSCVDKLQVEINNMETATTEEARTYFDNPVNSFSSRAKL